MSWMRCEHCADLVNTDDDPAAFTTDHRGSIGDGPCLCEPCRMDYYCECCGELPRSDDSTMCLECDPIRYDRQRALEFNAELQHDSL